MHGDCSASGNGDLTHIGFTWGLASKTDEWVDNKTPAEVGYGNYGYTTGSWGAPKSWDWTTGTIVPNTLYYWRAMAYGGDGWAYSSERSFTTLPVTPPDVTTNPATSVTSSTAIGNGEITNTHGAQADHRGFVYDTVTHGDPDTTAPADSDYSDYEDEAAWFGTGEFTRLLVGMAGLTQHFARAYAHNSAGYNYGDEIDFTTLEAIRAQAIMMRLFAPTLISAGGR